MANVTPQSGLGRVDRKRRSVLAAADRIPSLPDLVVRILNVIDDPATEPEDLAREISQDPPLVGKLLSLANSPLYSPPRPVQDIRDAVMLLGFHGVRTLVLASSTSPHLQQDYGRYGHSPRGLWLHSLTVGLIAKHLGTCAGMDSRTREELFIAGLLHDIGKMVLVEELSSAPPPHAFPGSVQELETKYIGVDHAEAGALVAAKWGLGEQVQEGITAHHDCSEASEQKPFLAILRLADALAHEWGDGYERGRAPEAVFRSGDRESAGLTGEDWREAREGAEQVVRAALDGLSAVRSG